MNVYLQKLTQATLSYFDVSQNEPNLDFSYQPKKIQAGFNINQLILKRKSVTSDKIAIAKQQPTKKTRFA